MPPPTRHRPSQAPTPQRLARRTGTTRKPPAPDAPPPDTAPPDTAPPDTAPPDTAPPDTAPPEEGAASLGTLPVDADAAIVDADTDANADADADADADAAPDPGTAEPEAGTAEPQAGTAEPEAPPRTPKAPTRKPRARTRGAGAPSRAARSRFAWPRALRGRPWGVPVALAALAVLLGGLAGWSALNARHLRGNASAANTALTDNAATSAVNGQIASAVNTLFSYDYTNLDKTRQAAHRLLVGKAVCEYDALFQVVRQQAPQQHLVVSVTVTNSGVEALTGNRARVLVYATQSSTSAVAKTTSTAGAMFAVDAVRQGGSWRIENIDTFTGDSSGSACT